MACITGAIAEAFYGVPDTMRAKAIDILDDDELSDMINMFEEEYQS